MRCLEGWRSAGDRPYRNDLGGKHRNPSRAAHYGHMDEVAEYVFQFNRSSEGKLLKFGAVAFSKSEDEPLARQVIDTFLAKN